MTFRFTRKELYERVWTEPKQTLAATLGVSDVALGKICRRADIPVPDRGYWAKKSAGKPTVRPALPLRFPGASDEIQIGRQSGWNTDWRASILEEQLPPPPVFDEPMDSVRSRITKMVKSAFYPPLSKDSDPLIAKLMAQDKERGESYSWHTPKYSTPQQKRWLRLLNTIFLATRRLGCSPSMSTSMYAEDFRDASVFIGSQRVNLKLSPLEQPKARRAGREVSVADCGLLCLRINPDRPITDARVLWSDQDGRIEHFLVDIVRELFVVAEITYRRQEIHHHEWLVKRKADLEEEEIKRRLEAEQRAQALREKQERERVNFLLYQADMLQRAQRIRELVSTVQAEQMAGDVSKKIEEWSRWALEQADRIDPLKHIELLMDANFPDERAESR